MSREAAKAGMTGDWYPLAVNKGEWQMTKLTLSNGTVILRRELDTDAFEAVVYGDEQRCMSDSEWSEYIKIVRKESNDRLQAQSDARKAALADLNNVCRELAEAEGNQ